jgi:hypothetical protein
MKYFPVRSYPRAPIFWYIHNLDHWRGRNDGHICWAKRGLQSLAIYHKCLRTVICWSNFCSHHHVSVTGPPCSISRSKFYSRSMILLVADFIAICSGISVEVAFLASQYSLFLVIPSHLVIIWQGIWNQFLSRRCHRSHWVGMASRLRRYLMHHAKFWVGQFSST